jgi:hypothetical protein
MQHVALIAILAFGGLLRALAAWHYWTWFDGEFPGLWDAAATTLSQDASTYIHQAGPPGYFADRLWGQLPFFRPPLASWYFAALFRLLGFDRLAVAVVQTGLAVLAYAAIYCVARRIVGSKLALLATLLTALHPVLIFFDRSFEDSVPALLFTALAIASLRRLSERRQISDAVLCGLMLSAAALARSNLLLLAPLGIVWLYLSSRGTPSIAAASVAAGRFSETLARSGIAACALVAIAALALTGIHEHKIPFSGIVLFGVARYEQMLVALVVSGFAAYFCVVADRSRVAFDGLIAAAISAVAIVLQPSTALLIGGVVVLRRFQSRSAPAGHASRSLSQSSPTPLVAALVLSLASGLVLASAHNWRTGGGATPLVSTGGQNLYWGNIAFAYHRITLEGPSGVAWLSPHEPTNVLMQGLMAAYPSRNSEDAMAKAAIAAIQEDPIAAVGRVLDKARRDLSGAEIARNESFADERVASPLFRLPLVPFSLVFGFAVCYVVLERRYREAAILLLPWLVVFASETVFFNASRYRSLAVPFLLPLSVAAVPVLWQQLRQRRSAAKAAAMLILIATLVVSGETAVSEQERNSERATELFKMARLELYYVDHRVITELRPANPERMVSRLDEALAIDPDHLSAHYLRSMWQVDRGDVEGARARNATRQSRCAAADWLCKEVCARIAQVADHSGQYRAYVEIRVAQTSKAVTEFSRSLESADHAKE